MFSLSGVFSLESNSSARQTQQALLKVLQDESLQMLSSLELNQWATLTFQVERHATIRTTSDNNNHTNADNDLCECLFATLRNVMSQPLVYSPLAIYKALAVAKHMLLLGATRVMNEGRVLLPAVTALLNYNTALLLAQHQTGATAFFLRLKGGTQDQGGPVREEATLLHRLLLDPALLQRERAAAADPNALVPVGKAQQIAFCTDEMRLKILQRTIQQQEQVKSNLVAQVSRDGFGGGYVSKDGKNVVGAAHSLEEMMQHAKRQESKFSDEQKNSKNGQYPSSGGGEGTNAGFAEYVAPTLGLATQPQQQQPNFAFATPPRPSLYPEQDLLGATAASTLNVVASGDLLSMSPNDPYGPAQPQQADLLGFEEMVSPPQQCATADNDILSLSLPSHNPASMENTKTTMSSQYDNNNDNNLLNLAGTTDPFASLSNTTTYNSSHYQSQQPAPPTMTKIMNTRTLPAVMGSPPQAATTTTMSTTMGNHRIDNAFDALNPLAGSTSGSVSTESNKPTLSAMSAFRTNSGAMSAGMNNNNNSDHENDDHGFVMGGFVGSGLDPMGHAPAAPPPPPPYMG